LSRRSCLATSDVNWSSSRNAFCCRKSSRTDLAVSMMICSSGESASTPTSRAISRQARSRVAGVPCTGPGAAILISHRVAPVRRDLVEVERVLRRASRSQGSAARRQECLRAPRRPSPRAACSARQARRGRRPGARPTRRPRPSRCEAPRHRHPLIRPAECRNLAGALVEGCKLRTEVGRKAFLAGHLLETTGDLAHRLGPA
jgi:hypothetical protein